MTKSVIDPATLEAFAVTHYVVKTPDPIILRIGQESKPLAETLREHGVRFAAFLTAWNPWSDLSNAEENQQAQAKLKMDIDGMGLSVIAGVGKDPSGKWPGEDSFLILGLDREGAQILGQKYRQNAFVWIGPDAIPQLVLLR